jgi:hypothetical protein
MTHERRFPDDATAAEIPQDKWQMSDPSGSRYLYVAKQMLGKDAKPLAYEPEIYPGPRWMLMTNGDLRSLSNQEIEKLFAAEKH